MEKLLRLYTYVDGGDNDTPFPLNTDNPIEIGVFRYDAKRMGGAPTITASVFYPSCLDDEWTDGVYAMFNGEKYFLKQTPTSSYNNENTMYKHDLELVSERVILDNVYFFDTVIGSPQGEDKPVSDSTKVVFFGGIREFVSRLNSSLQYSNIDYSVVVDDEIETEEKLMSFEDMFLSNVLQEIYNTYEVPYYFVGKTIHIGFAKEDVVIPTLGYGVDDALLSITKNNANYKTVNRVTGVGSSDNIPFYYPNNSPKGDIEAEVNTSSSDFSVKIVDYEKYSNEVAIGDTFTFLKNNIAIIKGTSTSEVSFTTSGTPKTKDYRFDMAKIVAEFEIETSFQTTQVLRFIPTNTLQCIASGEHHMNDASHSESRIFNNIFNEGVAKITGTVSNQVSVNGVDTIEFEVVLSQGLNKLKLEVEYKAGYHNFLPVGKINSLRIDGNCTWTMEGGGEYSCWRFKDNCVKIEDYGLSYNGIPNNGDTITQRLIKYVKTSQKLLPSIYRETDGAERFYNAINGEDGYQDESGNDIVFNNPYTEGRPKEHIITVDDLKPTIKETMVDGLRIDMFSEFAYDEGDNDETYEDEDGNVYFKHPYFYGKLRVMDFNLFDHAIENQPMTISFTSGDCGACNFEIGVTEEYPQKNPVQVDDNGNLLRDGNGMVLAGVEGTQQTVTNVQDRQQDTSKYEVWIALRKEEETYGILMPQEAYRPKACTEGQNDGDTFVILGINLPRTYILNAEKKLEAEIIKYMKDNNDEKFTFSIDFSRIYFEENPDVLAFLSENSKISIVYNNKLYDLYVSSFSYNMSEGDVLPEIRVELDETLKVSQNALQNAINQVKSELGRALGSIDVVGAATPFFLRKDRDDEVQGKINFKKGIKFGEGGKVEILDNNSAKLTIEYLEVTKKASFTSLEIQEKTHVGGQILVTPAAINCGEVEEFGDYYRCYFQTKGAEGDEIFNQFAAGDQAICQTFNAWGSKYYWRLVVGVGEDYIDLSKTDCDEDSGIPSAGDKIIQMGNREDEERQNAIVIAAYGDGSPYIIQYKGINSYEIPESKIVTMLSSTKNIFTGIVAMQAGSTGLEELQEFVDLQTLAEAAKEGLDNIEVGGQNLLRNSGFTGDYLSEQLADESVLESASELYSSPLDHWTSTNATVQDSVESTSGKEVVLSNGSLSQELDYAVLSGESYVLSFKAKGTSLTYSIGGAMKTITLTSEWVKYTEKITPTTDAMSFDITNATCTLCEIQFEKGNTATAWSNSPLDNSSDRAYYQSLKYLNQTIGEGTTVTQGGLILSSTINLGEWTLDEVTGKTKLSSVNAGINGVFGGDSASEVPAFWAGGNVTEAITTINKYLSIPSPTTSSGELPYVVTHSGRIIANDAIIRGTIYATNGEFNGVISVDAPNVSGRVTIDDNGLIYYGQKSDGSEYQRVLLGGTCQGASLVAVAPNADARYCVNAAILAVGDEETNAIHANGDVVIFGGTLYLNTIDFGTSVGEIYGGANIYGEVTFDGRVNGLRSTYVISDSNMHVIDCHNDASVLIDMTSGTAKVGVANAFDGNEVIIENRSATLQLAASKSIYDHYNGNFLSGEITTKGVIRLVYYEEVGYWTMTWIDRY